MGFGCYRVGESWETGGAFMVTERWDTMYTICMACIKRICGMVVCGRSKGLEAFTVVEAVKDGKAEEFSHESPCFHR